MKKLAFVMALMSTTAFAKQVVGDETDGSDSGSKAAAPTRAAPVIAPHVQPAPQPAAVAVEVPAPHSQVDQTAVVSSSLSVPIEGLSDDGDGLEEGAGTSTPTQSEIAAWELVVAQLEKREIELKLDLAKLQREEDQQAHEAQRVEMQGKIDELESNRRALLKAKEQADWNRIRRNPEFRAAKNITHEGAKAADAVGSFLEDAGLDRLGKNVRSEGTKLARQIGDLVGGKKWRKHKKGKKGKRRQDKHPEAAAAPSRPVAPEGFDAYKYWSANRDLDAVVAGLEGDAIVDALVNHWNNHGHTESGRRWEIELPSGFTPESYRSANPDLAAFSDAHITWHFKAHGYREGRRTSV